MVESELLVYVKASAAVLALPLDDEQVQRVALHLHNTARMAQLLEGAELGAHDELAEIYSPLAFPRTPNMRE
jgi:hypothetical protein